MLKCTCGRSVSNNDAVLRYGREPFLILVTSIRALFDFNHFRRFEHNKAVSAMCQKNDVTGQKHSAFKICPTAGSIDVHTDFPRADEKHFLCPFDRTRYGIMVVRQNFMS